MPQQQAADEALRRAMGQPKRPAAMRAASWWDRLKAFMDEQIATAEEQPAVRAAEMVGGGLKNLAWGRPEEGLPPGTDVKIAQMPMGPGMGGNGWLRWLKSAPDDEVMLTWKAWHPDTTAQGGKLEDVFVQLSSELRRRGWEVPDSVGGRFVRMGEAGAVPPAPPAAAGRSGALSPEGVTRPYRETGQPQQFSRGDWVRPKDALLAEPEFMGAQDYPAGQVLERHGSPVPILDIRYPNGTITSGDAHLYTPSTWRPAPPGSPAPSPSKPWSPFDDWHFGVTFEEFMRKLGLWDK